MQTQMGASVNESRHISDVRRVAWNNGSHIKLFCWRNIPIALINQRSKRIIIRIGLES